MRGFRIHIGVLTILLSFASMASGQAAVNGQALLGTLTGIVTDDSGAAIAEATVTLSPEGTSAGITATATADGRFSFADVPSGPYRLVVSSPGFASQTVSATLPAGVTTELPPIRLTLAFNTTSVDVIATVEEVAERQIKEQEQQRLFGVMPNYFVVYIHDAAPLTAKQKFELSRKALLDPVDFAFTGIVAGVQYARDDYSGFGRGPSGYAKRYAAFYATIFTNSALHQFVLPSLFKQDPRYFYKGEGSTASRVGYAMVTAVIRKGDNRHLQPNYSSILGSLAAGALTNFYYPTEDRRGARTIVQNSAVGIGLLAAAHLAQEFLYQKLTTNAGLPGRGSRRSGDGSKP
jgi:carboxypeptidase family protein